MICKNCNKENVDGVKFCFYCGSPMPAQQPKPPQPTAQLPQQPQYPQQPQQTGAPAGNHAYQDNYNQTPNNTQNVNRRPDNRAAAPIPQKKQNNTPLLIVLAAVGTLAVVAGVIVVLIATGVINIKNNNSDVTPVPSYTIAEEVTEQETTPVTEAPTEDERVTVPNVVGMKLEDANNALAEARLSHEVKREYSDAFSKDYVIKQDPPAGEKLEPGKKVTITVSLGSKTSSSSSKASSSNSSSSTNTGSNTDDRYNLQASSRYISRSDISWMTKDEIQLSINEIYAKHGLIFTNEPYSSYFRSKSWYNPDTNDVSVVAERMNDYELENLKVMGTYRNSL